MSTVAKKLSLSQVAAKVAAEHDDIEAAIDAFLTETNGDPEVVDALVRRGARYFLHDARHNWRGHVKAGESNNQPAACRRNTADAFDAVRHAASCALLQMQVGNKRLGELTGEEVREAGARLQEQGKGLLRTGRFFGVIADKTPAKGLVRNAWTERRVRKAWEGIK